MTPQTLDDWLADELWDLYPALVLHSLTQPQRREMVGRIVRRRGNEWREYRAEVAS